MCRYSPIAHRSVFMILTTAIIMLFSSIISDVHFKYWATLRAHSHCQPSRAEPSRTEPIRLGKQTCVMKWKHSPCTPNRAEPNRTEPDRACSLADVCFYSPADDRFCCAVGQLPGIKCVFFFTMSANTLDCEVLINAVHLRPALWEQSDKN
jgi:hypothetical protein